jgi:hypothetical protein
MESMAAWMDLKSAGFLLLTEMLLTTAAAALQPRGAVAVRASATAPMARASVASGVLTPSLVMSLILSYYRFKIKRWKKQAMVVWYEINEGVRGIEYILEEEMDVFGK